MSKDTSSEKITRRGMLAKLGMLATAAYAAPVVLQLGEAKASGFSGRSVRGGGARTRRSFSRPSGRRRSFSR
jgi:hypothetical protein